MKVFEYIIDSETEGMRLDRYLKKICKNENLSNIFRALRKGDIKVNGKKSKENYRLCLNDNVFIKYLSVEDTDKIIFNYKNKFKIDEKKYKKMIIFENDNFFIVNKLGNIPMHKGTGHEYGLSEIYKRIYENEHINFANRLDYETSGLVIGCKNLKFLRYISEKIRNNEVRKKYVAVVHGILQKKEFIIESYLKITENGVKEVKEKNDRKAKRSITKYKKIENSFLNTIKINNGEKTSLVEIDLITGRKHQIRVQLSNAGYPIVGDNKYGKGQKKDKLYLCCYSILFDEYEFILKEEKDYFK
ncbi:RluA family pseudouridine synthase [Leptotrichia sp. OH3620_COT-345]|uniref:RluA family pseudouridine synthase n=1 Tax=Leptotrichia sp. OH3620_COT-345 TaxID=2491048 RepID=UPI000F645407|nr:RluA family pseudouridine synthase [Leptotrichia sp. OH3620_COT-345]RRD39711.1 RluA family pseudouridine synthase [Leptotrichia sp. OH3620_COT-345]